MLGTVYLTGNESDTLFRVKLKKSRTPRDFPKFMDFGSV